LTTGENQPMRAILTMIEDSPNGGSITHGNTAPVELPIGGAAGAFVAHDRH
jgi:hypothetical protein